MFDGKPIVDQLRESIEREVQEAYQKGLEAGRKEGYKSRLDEAYTKGFSEGNALGLEAGRKEAQVPPDLWNDLSDEAIEEASEVLSKALNRDRYMVAKDYNEELSIQKWLWRYFQNLDVGARKALEILTPRPEPVKEKWKPKEGELVQGWTKDARIIGPYGWFQNSSHFSPLVGGVAVDHVAQLHSMDDLKLSIDEIKARGEWV